MTRDKALKVVQKLIRLYLATHHYHVEQVGQQWQWRLADAEATPADDELSAILEASEALIRVSGGVARPAT